jgi:hypothetical protein
MATLKEKLADALEKELETLPEFNGFGERNKKHEYADAINYLRTGIFDEKSARSNELLYDCKYDFETMCLDFELEDK